MRFTKRIFNVKLQKAVDLLIVDSLTKNTLVKNITALSLLQLLNYVFPFVTIPYVVRVLGVEKFGFVSFASAFIGYFYLLIDFGFNFSATKEISIHRDNKQKVSEIIFSVYIVKSVLFLTASLIFAVCLYTVPSFANDKLLYFFSFISVIGTLLYPQWYFQGIEKMGVVTFITFVSRLSTVILIFTFIRDVEDYKMYALLTSGGTILIGLISFAILTKHLTKIYVPPFSVISRTFKESSVMFISTVSINLYTTSNTFILGLFASHSIVGYWSAADKLRLAAQGIMSPITQGLYPHMSAKFNSSKEIAIKFLRKNLYPITGLAIAISLLLLIFAEPIVVIALGRSFTNSIIILKIISFLPFIILLSNIFGVQILLNLNGSKEFSMIVLFAGIFNLCLSLILVPKLLASGTAISVMVTEIIVTLLTGYYAKMKLKAADVI